MREGEGIVYYMYHVTAFSYLPDLSRFDHTRPTSGWWQVRVSSNVFTLRVRFCGCGHNAIFFHGHFQYMVQLHSHETFSTDTMIGASPTLE